MPVVVAWVGHHAGQAGRLLRTELGGTGVVVVARCRFGDTTRVGIADVDQPGAALDELLPEGTEGVTEDEDPPTFDEFLRAARDVPEIDDIQTLLGRVDVRMGVRARDLAHYQEIYRTRILGLPHIAEIEALMLVSELKNTEWLAL